jgi:hypothetical protein
MLLKLIAPVLLNLYAHVSQSSRCSHFFTCRFTAHEEAEDAGRLHRFDRYECCSHRHCCRSYCLSIVRISFIYVIMIAGVLTATIRWRDRGKEPEALPPPPYQQGDWVPEEVHVHAVEPPMTAVTPPTPKRKPKQGLAVGRHSISSRHRKTRSKVQALPFTPPRSSSPGRTQFQPQPEFNFQNTGEEQGEIEEQVKLTFVFCAVPIANDLLRWTGWVEN